MFISSGMLISTCLQNNLTIVEGKHLFNCFDTSMATLSEKSRFQAESILEVPLQLLSAAKCSHSLLLRCRIEEPDQKFIFHFIIHLHMAHPYIFIVLKLIFMLYIIINSIIMVPVIKYLFLSSVVSN